MSRMKIVISILISVITLILLVGANAENGSEVTSVLFSETYVTLDIPIDDTEIPRYFVCCNDPYLKWLALGMNHVGNSTTRICYSHQYYGIQYCVTCGMIYNDTPVVYRYENGCGQVL